MTAADTPVIPEDILLVLALVVLVGPLAWLAWRWLFTGAADARARLMATARARTRATVEDDSGDGGGHPNPRNILRPWKAGDMDPGG